MHAFNELNRKAKMLGGWFSSFKKSDAGFQLLEQDKAQRFCSLLNNDADRTDVLELRKERKELTAAERLHELATELFDRAETTIEQSKESLQNTVRRADIQSGVRGRAFADQAMSRTLHSIAEALSRGPCLLACLEDRVLKMGTLRGTLCRLWVVRGLLGWLLGE